MEAGRLGGWEGERKWEVGMRKWEWKKSEVGMRKWEWKKSAFDKLRRAKVGMRKSENKEDGRQRTEDRKQRTDTEENGWLFVICLSGLNIIYINSLRCENLIS